ncbi:MAG: SUMF1/EgtB/PvdO family nonheme iron enzyme [Bacteroidia bacterium]
MIFALTDFEKTLPHHEMIFVEGGEFDMGGNDVDAQSDAKPVHKVRVSSFYIGRYPVTQALWETVMWANPSHFKVESHPVEQVSWSDTQIFLQKLNIQTGKTYRLPSEAEWEFAARGGIYSQGYLYAGSDKLKEVGWYDENSKQRTHPVGQKMPNELDLYDLSGNVREWCTDWYSEDYYQNCADRGVIENPIGPDNSSFHVFRGGSWLSSPRLCAVVHRDSFSSEIPDFTLGFRLAMSVPNGKN